MLETMRRVWMAPVESGCEKGKLKGVSLEPLGTVTLGLSAASSAAPELELSGKFSTNRSICGGSPQFSAVFESLLWI
jgi:hypothetical protein